MHAIKLEWLCKKIEETTKFALNIFAAYFFTTFYFLFPSSPYIFNFLQNIFLHYKFFHVVSSFVWNGMAIQ